MKMIKNKEVANRFDNEVELWSSYKSQKDIISWERYKRYSLLCSFLKKKYKNKSISILEIGCGAGINISNYAKLDKNWQCTGVDISPQMIQYCSSKYKNIKNVSFEVLNIDKGNLNKKFDIIFLLGVVGYLENNKIAFKNINNMLKKDGNLFFTYGNKYSMFRFIRDSFSFVLEKTPGALSLYNFTKVNVFNSKIKYNPQANKFKPYSKKEIINALNNYYVPLNQFNICFAAGLFGNFSVRSSKILEFFFIKKDILNLSLTKFIHLKKIK